jgi:BioD-like phosphotransacetylase family protein
LPDAYINITGIPSKGVSEMVNLYVASIEPYSGKTSLCLALGLHYQARGLRVKYMKPVDVTGVKGGRAAGLDAAFIRQALGITDPVERLSPVLLGPDTWEEALEAPSGKWESMVLQAHRSLSRDCDLMILGGARDMTEGYALKLAVSHIAALLDAKLLLIVNHRANLPWDGILAARDNLEGRLIGVVINHVPELLLAGLTRQTQRFSEHYRIPVLGILPEAKLLSSISVSELARLLNGEILGATEKDQELVENFSVGAMNVESALTYFRRTPHKAVITGGDRADIQLAALETDTKCLVLTGNLYPTPAVLAQAVDRGVPIIVVSTDTLTTVRKVEDEMGHIRLQHESQIRLLREMVDSHVDFAALSKALGLPA